MSLGLRIVDFERRVALTVALSDNEVTIGVSTMRPELGGYPNALLPRPACRGFEMLHACIAQTSTVANIPSTLKYGEPTGSGYLKLSGGGQNPSMTAYTFVP